MKLFVRPVDFSRVNTLVYHLPEGPTVALPPEGIEEFLELELNTCHIWDSSDIDGVVHLFPRGNA
jgi:hypothetical protein